MLTEKGMTQQQFKTALARHGVELSDATISRTVSGERKLKPKELHAARKVFNLPPDESLDQLTPAEHVSGVGNTELDSTRSTTRPSSHERLRLHPFITGIAAGVVVLATVTAVITTLLSHSADDSTQSTSPRPVGNNNDASTPVVPPGCQQYEVAAKDLALRDEYGSPLVELARGTKVTVTNERHPRGLPYWQVTTETGQTNWVDHRYLKPAC
ncbi:hypothetical protein [Actinocrispum sp. NPDC049592]|uniref:hypothetical protein n=1 Tax=Actinocrispum sp. NPDC049592 TaxID=3154835 RepID=UPI0034435348